MPLPAPTHALPAKPGTAAPAPAPTTCALCPAAAKYTCPRCALRSCSAACSRAHKETRGCSGVRDPAAYVPLAKYGQGTWDGDYAWLEDGRRRMAVWGEGLTADEVAAASGTGPSRGSQGRGGGGRGGGARGPVRKSKLDGLRWAISEIGAEVDLLPDGMQRRRTNQSSWNPRTRALYLTVQLALPPSLSPDALVSHPRVPILPSAATLASLLPNALRESDLVFAIPYYVPRRHTTDATPPPHARRFFPPTRPHVPLDTALRGTAWVEFPTVHVFARDEWARALKSGEVVVMPLRLPLRQEEERPSKRAKVEITVKTEPSEVATEPTVKTEPGEPREVNGLAGLGDYGSDDSDDDSDDDGAEGEGEEAEVKAEDAETGDITLSPAMAAALGRALVADFGEVP